MIPLFDKMRKMCGADPLFVCRTGSKLFCDSQKDNDYVAVFEKSDVDYIHLRINGDCVFCYTKDCFEKMLTFQMEDFFNMHSVIMLFANGENLVFGQNPFPRYNWWNYRTKTVSCLLNVMDKTLSPPFATNAFNEKMCIKNTIWLFATYFVLQNRHTQFTPKQQKLLQLCHDNKLPVQYLKRLRTALLQMQEGFNLEKSLTEDLP